MMYLMLLSWMKQYQCLAVSENEEEDENDEILVRGNDRMATKRG